MSIKRCVRYLVLCIWLIGVPFAYQWQRERFREKYEEYVPWDNGHRVAAIIFSTAWPIIVPQAYLFDWDGWSKPAAW